MCCSAQDPKTQDRVGQPRRKTAGQLTGKQPSQLLRSQLGVYPGDPGPTSASARPQVPENLGQCKKAVCHLCTLLHVEADRVVVRADLPILVAPGLRERQDPCRSEAPFAFVGSHKRPRAIPQLSMNNDIGALFDLSVCHIAL